MWLVEEDAPDDYEGTGGNPRRASRGAWHTITGGPMWCASQEIVQCRRLASLLELLRERLTGSQEVDGSIPFGSTIFPYKSR